MLDLSKNVFLTSSCTMNTTILDNVLRVLANYKIPKDKIKNQIDMGTLSSGDYLIRCFDGKVQAWKIELTTPAGFTSRLVKNL